MTNVTAESLTFAQSTLATGRLAYRKVTGLPQSAWGFCTERKTEGPGMRFFGFSVIGVSAFAQQLNEYFSMQDTTTTYPDPQFLQNNTSKAKLLPMLGSVGPQEPPMSDDLKLSPLWLGVGAFALCGFVLSLL